MASYIIPPRQRSSDYTKGAITQDEYLRIAAANDANIAAARKAVKMGEVQQLTPIQSATPDELLEDVAKQQSDARSNLLRLGFRDQEAARITADLLNEPDLLRALNINFPAIEADIKKRFNPKLLTTAFFLQYLREYNETLNASRGLDVNSAAAVRRPINALINNVAELRAIIPDPAVIEYIRQAAQDQRFIGQETIERLDDLRRIVLGGQQLAAVGALPPAAQYQFIQEITDALRDVPTRAEVEALAQFFRDELRGGSNVERREIIDRINGLAAAVPDRQGVRNIEALFRDNGIPAPPAIEAEEEPVVNIQEIRRREREERLEVLKEALIRRFLAGEIDAQQFIDRARAALPLGSGMENTWLQEAVAINLRNQGRQAPSVSDITGTTTESAQSLSSSIALQTATLKEIRATFRAHPDLAEQLRASSNVGMYSIGDPVNYNDLQLSAPANRPNQRKIFINDTNLADIFRAKFGRGIQSVGKSVSKMGQKVAKKVMNTIGGSMRPMEQSSVKPSPLKRIKLGKGIAVQEQPTYREFGKYAIHIPQLEEQDILNVKYKSLGGIPKFKPFPVSDIFRDFLLDILDGKRANERVYLQIEPKERKAFEEIAIGAGVWSGLGLKRTTTNEDEEDRKRFEVLKGIYTAGNNSPQVSQELRRLIVKFINEGKMKRQQGLNLLMELSI